MALTIADLNARHIAEATDHRRLRPGLDDAPGYGFVEAPDDVLDPPRDGTAYGLPLASNSTPTGRERR